MNFQFKFLTCFKCSASGAKTSLYGIEDFREHYAVKHLDGFATRTCGTCYKSFATSFHCIWHARRGKCIPGKDRTIKLDATALDPIKVIKLNMAVSIAVIRHLFSATGGQLDKSSLSFLRKVQADDDWKDCVEDLRFETTPVNSFDPTDYYSNWYGSFPTVADYHQSMSQEDIQAYHQYYECYQQAFQQNQSNLNMFQAHEFGPSNSPVTSSKCEELATESISYSQIRSSGKETETECFGDVPESDSSFQGSVVGSVSGSLTKLNTYQQRIEVNPREDSIELPVLIKTGGVPNEVRLRRLQLAQRILSAKRSPLRNDDMDIDEESVVTETLDLDCFSPFEKRVEAVDFTFRNCEHQLELSRSCHYFEAGSSMELCSDMSLNVDGNVSAFRPLVAECITKVRRVKEEPASEDDNMDESPTNDCNNGNSFSLKLENNNVDTWPSIDVNDLSLNPGENAANQSLPSNYNGLSLKLEDGNMDESPSSDVNGLSLDPEENPVNESPPNKCNSLPLKLEENNMDDSPSNDVDGLSLNPGEKNRNEPLPIAFNGLPLKLEENNMDQSPPNDIHLPLKPEAKNGNEPLQNDGNGLPLTSAVCIAEISTKSVKEEPADEDQSSPTCSNVLPMPTSTECANKTSINGVNGEPATEENIAVTSPPEKYRIRRRELPSSRQYRRYSSSSSSDSSSYHSSRRSRSPASSTHSVRRRPRNRYCSSSSRSSSRSRSISLRRRGYSYSISPIRTRRRRRSSERSDRGWRYGFVARSVDINRSNRRSQNVRQRQTRRSSYSPQRSPLRRQCSPARRSRKDVSYESVKHATSNESPDSPPRRFVKTCKQNAKKYVGHSQTSDEYATCSDVKVNPEPTGPIAKKLFSTASNSVIDTESSSLDLIVKARLPQASIVTDIAESKSAKAQAMMSKIMNTLNKRAALRSVDPIASKPRDKALREARLYKKVRMIQRIKNNCSKKNVRKRVVPVPSQPIFVPETDDFCTQLLELRPAEFHIDVDYFGILQREGSNIPLGCHVQGTDWSCFSLKEEIEKMTVTEPRNQQSADSFPCFCCEYSTETDNLKGNKSTSDQRQYEPSLIAKISRPQKCEYQNVSGKINLKADPCSSSASIHSRDINETPRHSNSLSGHVKPFGETTRGANDRDRSFYDRLAHLQPRGRINEPNRMPAPDRRWPARHSFGSFSNYFSHHPYYYESPYFSGPQWSPHPAWYGGNPPF